VEPIVAGLVDALLEYIVNEKLFEAALGIEAPWFIRSAEFNAEARILTLNIDFKVGSRFALANSPESHPVHDTVSKRYRHLNFFQHECYLEVRTPRLKLPDGSVRLLTPPWAGRLNGFTLLFEALILMLCREMTWAAVARLVSISPYLVGEICRQYVELALAQADFSKVRHLAIDETSRARGQRYVTLAADADRRAVLFVGEGRDSGAITQLADHLRAHRADPKQIDTVTIDMSAAFIKGVGAEFPDAQITFDKFHVVAQANEALDQTRRAERKTAPDLHGIRWTLLKDPKDLLPTQQEALDELLANLTTRRSARAWVYREDLRAILNCKQINVMRRKLWQWTVNVMRSKVEPMKKVARSIRTHLEGIVAWARTRRTNGFLEALNGIFQAAKRRARGYRRFDTIRTIIFLLAGKLDFASINPYIKFQPT
jgi:transposase